MRFSLRQFIRLPRRRWEERRERQAERLLQKQQEWPSTPGPELQARAASSPWLFSTSPWSPTLSLIISKTPERHRSIILESYRDLSKYNLLQPVRSSNGINVRARQWRAMGGRRRGGDSYLWTLSGAGLGAVIGTVFSLNPYLQGIPATAVVLSVLGLVGGGIAGHLLNRAVDSGFPVGMVRVIVNERASVIRKAMVTDQAEAWIPKSLLAWRAHDWRYRGGQPYLWLMLPYGSYLHECITGSDSYLTLANDTWRARDEAVYSQKSLNRMLSDNALDYGDVDKGIAETPKHPLMEILPRFIPVVEVIGGVLVVIIALG